MIIKMSFSQDDVNKMAIEAIEKKFAVSIGDKYLVENGSIVLADEICADIAKKLYATTAKVKPKAKKKTPETSV